MPIRRSDIDTAEITPKLQHRPKVQVMATLRQVRLVRSRIPAYEIGGNLVDAGKLFHSSRKATRGSTRVARRAGT